MDDKSASTISSDILRQIVEDQEIEDEGLKWREETADCASPVSMYEQAPSGWNDAWQKHGHRTDCSDCRRTARVAFWGSDPGFWILQDRENAQRPLWWRQAIGDYLETASGPVKAMAKTKQFLDNARHVLVHSFGNPEQLVLAARGMGFRQLRDNEAEYRQERLGSSLDEAGELQTLLWKVTKKGKDEEAKGRDEKTDTVDAVTFYLVVRDHSDSAEAKTVEAGVTGRRTLIREIVVNQNEDGQMEGDTEITMDEMAEVWEANGTVVVLEAQAAGIEK